MIQLANETKKQDIKTISHISGKTARAVERHDDSDFLLATADTEDDEVVIYHSSDPQIKQKFLL